MEPTYEQLKLDNQLCFPLYAAARKVVGLYTPYLKALDLTYTQYITLMVLWEKDGIPVGELGSRLFLDSGTLTPLLKKLADRGLVTRERSREDERVVCVYLTDKGRQMREEVKDIPAALGSCVPLSPEEGRTLYVLLYKILGKTF